MGKDGLSSGSWREAVMGISRSATVVRSLSSMEKKFNIVVEK